MFNHLITHMLICSHNLCIMYSMDSALGLSDGIHKYDHIPVVAASPSSKGRVLEVVFGAYMLIIFFHLFFIVIFMYSVFIEYTFSITFILAQSCILRV